MRYLIMNNEDGEVFQSNKEPNETAVEAIDQGLISIIRFENGQFETAAVHAHDDSRSLSWGPLEEK